MGELTKYPVFAEEMRWGPQTPPEIAESEPGKDGAGVEFPAGHDPEFGGADEKVRRPPRYPGWDQ